MLECGWCVDVGSGGWYIREGGRVEVCAVGSVYHLLSFAAYLECQRKSPRQEEICSHTPFYCCFAVRPGGPTK